MSFIDIFCSLNILAPVLEEMVNWIKKSDIWVAGEFQYFFSLISVKVGEKKTKRRPEKARRKAQNWFFSRDDTENFIGISAFSLELT